MRGGRGVLPRPPVTAGRTGPGPRGRPARGRTPFARRAGPDRVNPGGHHRVAACPRTPPHGAASGGEDRPRRGAGHAWWPWRPATATGLCRPDGSRPADRASVVVAVVQHLVADPAAAAADQSGDVHLGDAELFGDAALGHVAEEPHVQDRPLAL